MLSQSCILCTDLVHMCVYMDACSMYATRHFCSSFKCMSKVLALTSLMVLKSIKNQLIRSAQMLKSHQLISHHYTLEVYKNKQEIKQICPPLWKFHSQTQHSQIHADSYNSLARYRNRRARTLPVKPPFAGITGLLPSSKASNWRM